ncbi:hypothetical protein EI94DRAFT_1598597, partial [Lactarius quietus]
TVNSLLTHTFPWTPRTMGFDRVWGRGETRFLHTKCMGFQPKKVWIIGFERVMGYGHTFPVNQPGGQNFLWDIIEYG